MRFSCQLAVMLSLVLTGFLTAVTPEAHGVRLLRPMEADAEVPIKPDRAPVFVAQGTADRVVHPPAARTTAMGRPS